MLTPVELGEFGQRDARFQTISNRLDRPVQFRAGQPPVGWLVGKSGERGNPAEHVENEDIQERLHVEPLAKSRAFEFRQQGQANLGDERVVHPRLPNVWIFDGSESVSSNTDLLTISGRIDTISNHVRRIVELPMDGLLARTQDEVAGRIFPSYRRP